MNAKELNALVHDREAASYDDRFLIRYDGAIGRAVERDVVRLLGVRPSAGRALDVACGTGYLAVGLAAAGIAEEVHGCDLSAKMLERTRDNATAAGVRVHVALCDAERLPYPDGMFDLVCARGALHHVPAPADALREMRRVLSPGGTAFVVAEPTAAGERQVAAVVGLAVRAVEAARRLRRTPRDEDHHTWELASMAANLHTFTPAEIAALAREAGFTDVNVGAAAWAWVLALGINYYLAGEIGSVFANPVAKYVARAVVESAAVFDRIAGDRLIPPAWRHTVQAVLR